MGLLIQWKITKEVQVQCSGSCWVSVMNVKTVKSPCSLIGRFVPP